MDHRKKDQAGVHRLVRQATSAVRLGKHHCTGTAIALPAALFNTFVAG